MGLFSQYGKEKNGSFWLWLKMEPENVSVAFLLHIHALTGHLRCEPSCGREALPSAAQTSWDSSQRRAENRVLAVSAGARTPPAPQHGAAVGAVMTTCQG